MTLLISKVNQLGDNIVFLPVVQTLQRLLPDARLVVVTSPVARELYADAAANRLVLTEPTVAFNSAWRRPWTLPRLIADWRSVHPDAVLLGDDQGHVAHLLAWASGAAIRVGPASPYVRLGGTLTNRITLDFATLVAAQNWELMLALLRRLGVHHALPPSPPPPDLSHLLSRASDACRSAEVIIHPGASRDYKRWPLDHYVSLANALSAQHAVTWIETSTTSRPQALDACVTVRQPSTLSDLAGLLAGARLFIGNNSGPMNLASALGTPGIIFNGPSTVNWDPAWHAERFTMLRDPQLACQPCDQLTRPVNQCANVQFPMACMTRWSVEEVLQLTLAKLR